MAGKGEMVVAINSLTSGLDTRKGSDNLLPERLLFLSPKDPIVESGIH